MMTKIIPEFQTTLIHMVNLHAHALMQNLQYHFGSFAAEFSIPTESKSDKQLVGGNNDKCILRRLMTKENDYILGLLL